MSQNNTHAGNFPVGQNPLKPSSTAAIIVRERMYRLFTKKFCMFLLGLEYSGFAINP